MEAAVSRLVDGVWCERLQQFAGNEVVFVQPLLHCLELGLVVTVVDAHSVPGSDEPVVLETGEPAHSSSSVTIPVGTSAEHMGHVTVSTMPTMKLNPHSGHSIFGIGSSGRGGGC